MLGLGIGLGLTLGLGIMVKSYGLSGRMRVGVWFSLEFN